MNAFEGNLLNKPKPNQINKPRNTSVGNPSTLYAQPQYTQPKSGWYAGDQPTASETIAQIYKVGKDNPDVLSQLNDMFNAEIMNPESNLYQPYLMPTTDKVNDTNIRNTNNATNEWNQLQAELAYWANRTDRNYSDDEIINRIDMTKYPTLAKMDEYKTTGVTMDLLAPVGYSKDAMYGVLWAARNGGQTSGNYLVDAAQGIMGNGNKYQRDEELYGRRDATSDNYAPYTVGATALDDLSYKYGMQGDFTEEWLNGAGRALLNGDAQAKTDYTRIYNTVMNTKKLNEETERFNSYVQKAIESGVDPDEFFTDEFESDMKEDYPELYKALEGQRSGKLYETSGAVGFDYNKAQRDMKANWDRINGNVTPDQMDAAMSAEFGLPDNKDEAQAAIDQQASDKAAKAGWMAWNVATDDERTTIGSNPAQFDSSKATGGKMMAVAGADTDAPHRTAMNAANAYAGEYYLNARKIHDGLVAEFYGNDAMRSLLETYFPEHAANGTVPSLNEFVALEESNEEFSTAVFQAGKFFGNVGEKLKQLDNEKKILKGVDERYKLAEELGQGGSARDFLNFVYQFDGYEAHPMTSVAVWSPKQYKQNSELIAMFGDYISKAEELKVPAEYVDGLRAAVEELQTNNYLMEASKLKYVGDFGEKVKEFDESQKAYVAPLVQGPWNAVSHADLVRFAIVDVPSAMSANVNETDSSIVLVSNMTDTEKNIYKYIYSVDGEEAATEYFDALTLTLSYRGYEQVSGVGNENFDNAGEAIGRNVGSVLINALSSMNVFYKAYSELTGKEVNKYDPMNWLSLYSQKTRESSKRQINEQLGEGSFAASLAIFGYDAGMASADSMTSALFGGGSTGGLILMGGSAMSNALMDAEMRGAEGVQKWVYAGAVAAAEVLTEKLPMDALADALKSGSVKSVKEFFAGALKQLGKGFITDAPGEMLSEFFGEMADQIIMDEMANYAARIEQLVNEEGLSPEEAQLVADREVLSNMLYAFALGGVSAGGSNVAAYTVGSVFGGNENEDGGSETKPTEEQPANEQKPKNKWVAAAEEMAEAETVEGSSTEQAEEATAEVPEAVQNDPVKSAEAVLAKAESLGTGTTESAGLIASVMEGVAGMDSMEADAAARTIAAKWKDPLFTTRRMIRNSPDAARTLHAMELAALVPDSQTAEAINTMVESGEVTPEAVGIVNTVYEQEMADNGLRERLDAKIASMATAETTVGLLAQSDLESIKQLDADAAAAKAQMEKAQAEYDSLSERMNADMAALDSARDAFYANLADETVKNKYLQVYERYRQNSDKMLLANDNLAAAQKNHADAKAKAETGRTELLNSARVEAKAQVAQRMEQRRSELEALAQQEAQAAETKRQNDNVLSLQADDFVNTYYANAPAEVKAKIREQYMAYEGETKNVTRDMTQFASQISKKFGLEITFTDSHGIFEGAYMGGNRIVLDKNATQGDVIKAVLTHEIVHAAETSNEYNEFADAVLDAYYQGNTKQMEADLAEIAKQYSDRAGQTDVARSELVAKRLSNLLNDNPKALDRLIAEKPNVAQRIWQSIKDFIAKMTGVHDKALDTAIQLEKKLEKALGGRTADNDIKFAMTVNEQTESRQFKHWFGNSKIVNEDGSPKVMYRGGGEEIHVFDRKKSKASNLYGRGFYFTDSETHAKQYGEARSYYLRVENPLNAQSGEKKITPKQMRAFLKEVAENEDYGLENYGYDATVDSVLNDLKGKSDFDALQDINATAIGDFVAAIELFNEVNGTNYDGIITPTETVVFDSKQIKSATDNVGTFDPQNPDVRFSLPSTDVLNDQIARHQSEQNAPQQDFGTGERQFVAKTLPGNPNIPQWAVEGMQNNPEARYYEKDTNRAQLIRAWQRIQENGVEAERERLVNLEGYSADDTAEANLLMAMALREDTSDPATFFQLAFTYDVEGTDTAQSFQARKMFSKMTPDGARIWAAGKSEQATAGYLDSHKPYRENLDQRANDVADSIRDKQSGNELLRLTSGGDFTIDSSNNKWGVPLNEQQLALIEHYGLQNEARPGIFYNRATIKQRMLEAIIATHNPLEVTNLGLNLIHRLEMMKDGKAVVTMADLNYIGDRLGEFMGLGQDAGGRAADVALARAYEAFGNITPASGWEKFRTHRYVNMLLSVPTFTRNIMGNAFQNALNAASHGIAVELDKKQAKKTGQRTLEHLSVEERVNGWKAFAEETKNTFKDFFIDKVDAAPNKEKYSTGRKGRVFQNGWQEGKRNLESFMMSFGDRNVWKKAFVNSMAEQQKLADRGLLFNDNGTTRTHEQMVEKAEEAANFATFTEDSFVQKLMGYVNEHNPRLGDALSIYIPFTGVPSNIMKRSVQYSPMGLMWALGKRGYQHLTKQNFDQQKFVEGVARGLTGTAMMAVGALLGAAGFIRMGTEDDESDKVYDANTAIGKQYTPYVYDPTTGTYVSLSTFAPALSPFIWGAAVVEGFNGDESLFNIFINGITSTIDSILDASYLSGISDVFGGYGSITENIIDVGINNLISQTIPALITQTANALDPYVRDTKDKDKIMEAVKKAVNKIPGLRNILLPEKITVAGENVPTKPGLSNFYDPFTRTTPSKNEALGEAMRLYEALRTTDVLPSDALRGRTNSFSLKLDKVQWTVTLNDEQKEEYKKYYGDLWTSRVSELMSDFHYQQLDDKQKGAKIKKILQDCLKEAKTEFLKRYGHKVEE